MEPSSAQLAALAVVLDRPELAADPRLLCSAARVCNSWRAAVAASGAGTTDVVLWFSVPSEDTAKGVLTIQDHMVMLSSFAAWLSHHGSLVRSINLHGLAGNLKATVITACQMLGMALQLATARAGARPMKLQAFKSDGGTTEYGSRPLLAALPDCLTELHVTADEGLSILPARDQPPLSDWMEMDGLPRMEGWLLDVLTRLKHLRKLCINRGAKPRWILQPQALMPLTSLTCLELHWAASNQKDMAQNVEMLHRMPSLQQLLLDVACLSVPQEIHVCELETMTALTKLHLGISGNGHSGAKLPQQLQDLTLHIKRLPEQCNPITDMKLKKLKSLRSLHLICQCKPLATTGNSLEEVKLLTQLSSLELSYRLTRDAVADAASWCTFPKIRALRINDEDEESWNEWQGAEDTYLRAVRGLQHLTCLELNLVIDYDVCEISSILSGLVSLQHLHLMWVVGPHIKHECLKLCHLSRLTHLSLIGAYQAVGDTVAAALASSMPLLRHLELPSCEVSSEIVIPAIARLQHLTQLVLTRNTIGDQTSCSALIKQLREPN